MCVTLVVCAWIRARQHAGEVFICITCGLRGSSYLGAHGVHLHQNLYFPKPSLGYTHMCTHTQAHFPV